MDFCVSTALVTHCSGFFISLDVSPQLDAPFQHSPPLQAYVAALQRQRVRSSIPHVVTYIMRPVVFTSSWGVEGLGIIVVQVSLTFLFILFLTVEIYLLRSGTVS